MVDVYGYGVRSCLALDEDAWRSKNYKNGVSRGEDVRGKDIGCGNLG